MQRPRLGLGIAGGSRQLATLGRPIDHILVPAFTEGDSSEAGQPVAFTLQVAGITRDSQRLFVARKRSRNVAHAKGKQAVRVESPRAPDRVGGAWSSESKFRGGAAFVGLPTRLPHAPVAPEELERGLTVALGGQPAHRFEQLVAVLCGAHHRSKNTGAAAAMAAAICTPSTMPAVRGARGSEVRANNAMNGICAAMRICHRCASSPSSAWRAVPTR